MVFVWTMLQWNLMARSVNIEPLALHNVKVFRDSLQVLYDDNKADQGGEKTTTKHLYANPNKPYICPFLAIAIYCSLYASKFAESEFFFKKKENIKKKRPAATTAVSLSN